MKTLQEIKDEVAKEYKFTDWEDLMRNTGDRVQDRAADEATHRYAREVAREALKNASENFLGQSDFAKDTRNAILDENNIPEL